MEDPRIADLMECVKDVDDEGNPTTLALIAKRVKTYIEMVDALKEELSTLHSDISKLETRAESLSQSLEQKKSLRADISEMAQEAAVKAAYSNSSRGATFRKEAAEKQKGLQQFEGDFSDSQKRLKEVMRALEDRRGRLTQTRDLIAHRMNIIDTLLQRAEVEWTGHFVEENERLKGQQGKEGAQPLRRRRRGRRRIVRRRAS